MVPSFATRLSCCAALVALSCANVLGIEDAKVDPSLEQQQHEDSGMQMASLCERYCDTVMQNCVDTLAVYKTPEVCMAICATLEEGNAGDQTGNTVHCRLRNAELAQSTGEPAGHCSNAGPGGNGICGTNCEGYCTEMMQVCQGEFSSFTDCITVCETLPDLGHFDVSLESGGTIQCRLYHVTAATLDDAFHCPHAAGASPCDVRD